MFKINLDGLGIAASLACAIHCAVLPLFFSSLPLLGFNLLDSPAFELTMIGLAAIIGSVALWHGYTRHHRSIWPLTIFLGGILLLAGKELSDQSHSWYWVAPAVTCIVGGHVFNYLLCRRANACHTNGNCKH